MQGHPHEPASIRVALWAQHSTHSAAPQHNPGCSSPVFVPGIMSKLTNPADWKPESKRIPPLCKSTPWCATMGAKAVTHFFHPDCSRPMTQIMENWIYTLTWLFHHQTLHLAPWTLIGIWHHATHVDQLWHRYREHQGKQNLSQSHLRSASFEQSSFYFNSRYESNSARSLASSYPRAPDVYDTDLSHYIDSTGQLNGRFQLSITPK